jgi:hypothetical protein
MRFDQASLLYLIHASAFMCLMGNRVVLQAVNNNILPDLLHMIVICHSGS